MLFNIVVIFFVSSRRHFSVVSTLVLKLTIGHRGSLGGPRRAVCAHLILIEGGLGPVCVGRAIRVAYGQITHAQSDAKCVERS